MEGNTVLRARDAKACLFGAVVLGLLAAAATVAQAVLLGEIVARVLLSGAGPGELGRPLSLLLCVVAARPVFVWLREVVALRGAVRARRRVRERLLGHVFALGPARHAGGTGGLVTTVVEGVERLEAYFGRYLPQVYLSALVPLLISACVLWLDPLSGIVLLATGPAIPVLMVLIGKQAESRTRLQWEALSRLGSHFLDALRGLPTLKTWGRAEAEREKVREASEEFSRRTMGVLRVAFVSGFALEFIATVSVALVAVLLAVRLLFGELPLAIALPALLLAPEFYRPLRDLGASRHAGMEGKAAAEGIAEILDAPLPEGDAGDASRVPESHITVELEDVGFAYPEADRPALSGVNLALPAGTRTALVGPSGAGKSTLVDLLLRFAEPLTGRILANGVPISELDPEDWRACVALVPQRPYLFHGSVLENLRVARPDAGREEVVEAARLAGAHGFVERMARGYDTHVGEGGARLSGGEIRRLAIARAFLKNSPLILLDEPASGLDPEGERLVEEALERVGRERTVLAVAHRLGAARTADRVSVLQNGRLVESGTHEELVGTGGPYARLANAAAGDGTPARWDRSAPGLRTPPGPSSAGTENPVNAGNEEPGPENRRARGTLWRLLGFLWPQRRRVASAAVLSSWTMGANVGLLAASGYLVAASAQKPPLSALIPAAVLVQVLGSSRGASRYFERLISHKATFGLLATLRAWLYGRLVPLSPARLARRRGGDLLSRVVDDVDELQNVYLGAISPVLAATAVSALVFAILGVFDPTLALTTLAFLIFAGVGAPLLAGALERGLGRGRTNLRAALSAEVAEAVRGMRDLLAFGRAGDRLDGIRDLGRKLAREQDRTALATGLREGLHDLAAGLAMWTVLFLALPLLEGGGVEPVYLALAALTALAGFEAVRPLGEALQSLGRSTAAGGRVFEISDSEPAVSDPEKPLPAPAGRRLGLDRVALRYEPDEPPALDGVSLALETGRKVAVVGPSGSGKSTVVNLLLRFWDPASGTARLDGEDLRLYAQRDVRATLSVAAQDAHVLDATVRENLLLARPEATKEELRAALETAQLDGFVRGLPHGLETRAGELGSRLSGGERRRLVAARAFLRDAPFLVLDEPTADLDATTERRFMDAVHDHVHERGRGLLLITHRLVGMERMDEILVLERGRVTERGPHEDLMRSDGPYRRMVGVQDRMLVG